MSEIDVTTMWSGRCRNPCGIIWWWPRDDHKLRHDFGNNPQCPKCQGALARTSGTSKDKARATTRAEVGLGEAAETPSTSPQEDSDEDPLEEDTRSRAEKIFDLICKMTLIELRDLNIRLESELGFQKVQSIIF